MSCRLISKLLVNILNSIFLTSQMYGQTVYYKKKKVQNKW